MCVQRARAKLARPSFLGSRVIGRDARLLSEPTANGAVNVAGLEIEAADFGNWMEKGNSKEMNSISRQKDFATAYRFSLRRQMSSSGLASARILVASFIYIWVRYTKMG